MAAPAAAALDVVGIGNALVDVLTHADDDFLDSHGMVKGTMALVPTEEAANELYDDMDAGLESSGGSVANTIAGIAGLGGRAGFIGRIRDDQLGAVFAHDLGALGVTFTATPATDGPSTGRCLILVSPDAERTMNTYLGASGLLGPDDVDIDADLVASAAITYLEGYLFDSPANREAYRRASEIARAAGRRVGVTLSDVFCVERHRDEWLSLVVDHVDVLFGNEAELRALYQLDDFDACVDAVREHVDIAAITRSEHGSVVATPGETIAVPAYPIERIVDTTGAGDLYAAGFLYGLTHERSLEDCARLGALAAAEVISHTGPRPEADLAALAKHAGLL
jgi:sugar/nucleoside kinase (ribokinase family)